MAIECNEISYYWAVIPCKGDDALVTAWVETSAKATTNEEPWIHFGSGDLWAENGSAPNAADNSRWATPFSLFARVVRRFLERSEEIDLGDGLLAAKDPSGDDDVGDDELIYITSCGEGRVFQRDDIQALLEWATED